MLSKFMFFLRLGNLWWPQLGILFWYMNMPVARTEEVFNRVCAILNHVQGLRIRPRWNANLQFFFSKDDMQLIAPQNIKFYLHASVIIAHGILI